MGVVSIVTQLVNILCKILKFKMYLYVSFSRIKREEGKKLNYLLTKHYLCFSTNQVVLYFSWSRHLQHTSLYCFIAILLNIHLEIIIDIISFSKVTDVLIWFYIYVSYCSCRLYVCLISFGCVRMVCIACYCFYLSILK